jgi:hypothetical protein
MMHGQKNIKSGYYFCLILIMNKTHRQCLIKHIKYEVSRKSVRCGVTLSDEEGRTRLGQLLLFALA